MIASTSSYVSFDIVIGADVPAKLTAAQKTLQKMEQHQANINARIEEYSRKLAVFEEKRKAGVMASEKTEFDRDYNALMKKYVLAVRAEQQSKQAIREQKRLITDVNRAWDNAYKEDYARTEQAAKARTRMWAQANAENLRRDAIAAKLQAREQARLALLKQQSTWAYKIQQQMDKFGTVFMRVADALGSFFIINTVVNGFRALFSSMYESGTMLQKYEARMKSLGVTSQEMARDLNMLRELTVKTPFTFSQIVDAAARVKAYGIDIASNMEAIADWSTVMNRDINDTAVAFGKIVQASPRTAMLLSTRGLNIEVYKGYIDKFGDRSIALTKYIEDSFEKAASKMSLTFEGMLTNLYDRWLFIAAEMSKPVLTGLTRDLTTLSFMMDKLAGNSFFEKIGTFIARMYRLSPMGIAGGYASLMDMQAEAEKLSIRLQSKTAGKGDYEKGVVMFTELIAFMKEFGLRTDGAEKALTQFKNKLDELTMVDRGEKIRNLFLPSLTGEFEIRKAVEDAGLSKWLKGIGGTSFLEKWIGALGGKADLDKVLATKQKQFEDSVRKWALAILGVPVQEAGKTKQEFIEELMDIVKLKEMMSKGQKAAKDYGAAEVVGPEDKYEEYIRSLNDLNNAREDFILQSKRFEFALAGQDREWLLFQLKDLETRKKRVEQSINEMKAYANMTAVMYGVVDWGTLDKINDLEKDRLDVMKNILQIQEELSKVSMSWGEAWIRQLGEINKELQSFYDTFAKEIIATSKEATRGLLDELLFGKERKRVTDQLNETQYQLFMIQEKRRGITMVEDEEATYLARINELERERANIYLNVLLSAANKLLNKFEDYAINLLFQGILKGFGGPKTSENNLSTNYRIPMLPHSGPTGPTQKMVMITGNTIVGVEGFNKMVDKAIKEIRSNLN